MKKGNEIQINGSCLQAVVSGVNELSETVRKFKDGTRTKLEFLYMPIDVRGFGMTDTDGIKIQMHNLGRSIENIELWFNLMEMLLENMEDDLKTIAAVQKVRNSARQNTIAEEMAEIKAEKKRERDRENIKKKRNADRAAS